MSELYNDRDYFDRMFGSIDNDLFDIKEHLKRLNGSVASHEKTINENLPHNIAHCSQTENIKKLQDNMVTEKAVKKTIYIGFAIVCGLLTAIWTVMEIIK